MPNNVNGIDIRNNPYTGFIIISRRYCGAEFTSSIMSGDTKIIIMDTEAVYQVDLKFSNESYYEYVRITTMPYLHLVLDLLFVQYFKAKL